MIGLAKISIKIYDLNLQLKDSEDLVYINDNAFNKLIHIKNEIGAFIYFEKNKDIPNIIIKKLKDNFSLEKVFTNYDNIKLNADGLYTLNPGLFYSDAIKINKSKFAVILTTNDLLNFIICLFDIYDDNSSLRLRYYKLELEQLNIKISVNIRSFVFNNLIGIIFYNSNTKYPGYITFNYPKYINESKINDTTLEINLFIDSTSYIFSFIENMELNNILSKKIKIINFPSESQTGIIIKSFNKNNKISINNELELNDKLIFEQKSSGVFPGTYILEFSFEPDKILYYKNVNANFDNKYYDRSQAFDYYIFYLIFKVECPDNCQKCNNLGSDAYSCINCEDGFPYKYNNNKECLDLCDYYIYNDEYENVQYCKENCDNGQFIYTENEYEKYCINICDDDSFIYINNENNNKYCLDYCDNDNYIYNNNNDNKIYCLSSCLYNNEVLYLDEDTNNCYQDCSEIGNDKIYIYQNKCVRECPINYIFDENNICYKENDIQSTYVQTDIQSTQAETSIINDLNTENSIKEKINNLNNLINLEIDNNNKIEEKINKEKYIKDNINSIINNFLAKNSEMEMEKTENNSMVYCYSSKSDLNSLMNLNPNLTYINLKECEEKIIKEYKLNGSDLIILGIQSGTISENSLVNYFNYELYSRDGKKLNNSICENTDIEISSPMTNLDLIDLEKALKFREQGYDIFNKSSEFYYDVCSSAYLDESDLPLSVRQEDIYPENISLCQNGCEYNGVDLENKRVFCKCNPILPDENEENNEENDQSDQFIEEVEENFFIYIIDMINYQIAKCYKLLFDIKNYYLNFGLYIGFFIGFLILILCLDYCFQGKKQIKIEYLKNEPKINEIQKLEKEFNKKYNNNNNNNNNENYKKYKNNNNENYKKSQRLQRKRPKTFFIRKANIFIHYSNPSRKITKKSKTKIIKNRKRNKNEIVINNNNQICIINSNEKLFINSNNENENFRIRKKLSENVLINENTISPPKKKTNNNNINYNNLTYGEALKKDKRNIIKIFISLFKMKLEFIQLLIYPRDFSHKSLTFSLYFFDLLLDLTINSLLFSDDVISQKYYNNGQLQLITSNILSISSNIICKFILFIIGKLINYYDILENIKIEIKNQKHFYYIFIKILHLIELFIIIFYFLLFLIGLLCIYYLFIFCALYKKIQKNLFINYIIGTLWSLAFTVGICLIVTIIRKIAIKQKIKRLYLISKFIDDKF